MWKIDIYDDEISATGLSALVRNEMDKLNAACHIRTYTDSEQLFSEFDPYTHLYFLNVTQPTLSAFQIADFLRRHSTQCQIIFVSNIEEYVYRSFCYQPLRFIRKEKIALELPEALRSFLNIINTQHPLLSLHTRDSDIVMDIDSIMYIESHAHYLNFYSVNDSCRVRGKISDYFMRLENHYFLQPNQSNLVNCKYIKCILSNKIILENNVAIAISRSQRQSTQNYYREYTRNIRHGIFI